MHIRRGSPWPRCWHLRPGDSDFRSAAGRSYSPAAQVGSARRMARRGIALATFPPAPSGTHRSLSNRFAIQSVFIPLLEDSRSGFRRAARSPCLLPVRPPVCGLCPNDAEEARGVLRRMKGVHRNRSKAKRIATRSRFRHDYWLRQNRRNSTNPVRLSADSVLGWGSNWERTSDLPRWPLQPCHRANPCR